MKREFGKGYWKTFREGLSREWVVTNGLGGYAGDTVTGAHARKHHGLLIASLRPPVERYLVVSKVEETLVKQGKSHSLAANQREGGREEGGWRFLERFSMDSLPTYHYRVEDIRIRKTIAMDYGHNTSVIGYEVENGSACGVLVLTPFFHYREHGEGRMAGEEEFTHRVKPGEDGVELELVPRENRELRIRLYCSEGQVQACDKPLEEAVELQTELDTGMSGRDGCYSPYVIRIPLKACERKRITVTASIEEEYPRDAFEVIDACRRRKEGLVRQAVDSWVLRVGEGAKSLRDLPLFTSLVKAADDFIVERHSTGSKTILAGLPWFTDWGRDTMIALQGLTLATGRYEDAKSILRTFAAYVKNGLVPNMFPDEGLEPLYNTVDASLWYFHAVDQYLAYVQSEEACEFVREELYPKLKEIMTAYREGTLFSIYMDADGLVHAGGGLDQVTWMDVRVGEWVVTPRHGKPVEINALWYNALCVMAGLTKRYEGRDRAREYELLAERVKKSFCEKFWNEAAGCLFDVVEDDDLDGKNNGQLRPNQIYAVSLPHTMLSGEQERALTETVFSHLYTTYGIRSLSPEDPAYRGLYKGSLQERDGAYHQGTAWGFLLGGFISACKKVGIGGGRELAELTEDHLRDGCIGQIAEIFDGDSPNISRGCYGQAWSVGEVLRAYAEEVAENGQLCRREGL